MIGGNFTEITRDSWTFVPGRKVVRTFDANGNVLSMTYYDNNTAIFVRNFTYDTYGNCIETECVNP